MATKPKQQPSSTSGSRSGRYQPNDGDVGNPTELARLVRDLYSAKFSLEERVKTLEDELAKVQATQTQGQTISDTAIQQIRAQLQSTGKFPLDLTGLTTTTTPPVGKAVVTSTALTNENQYGANAIGIRLIGASARVKDEIWYVKDGNPKVWTKLVL